MMNKRQMRKDFMAKKRFYNGVGKVTCPSLSFRYQ